MGFEKKSGLISPDRGAVIPTVRAIIVVKLTQRKKIYAAGSDLPLEIAVKSRLSISAHKTTI
jgi:hypothetical protein